MLQADKKVVQSVCGVLVQNLGKLSTATFRVRTDMGKNYFEGESEEEERWDLEARCGTGAAEVMVSTCKWQ